MKFHTPSFSALLVIDSKLKATYISHGRHVTVLLSTRNIPQPELHICQRSNTIQL